MKRIALGLVAVTSACTFAVPASAAVCAPVVDWTDRPFCLDLPVTR